MTKDNHNIEPIEFPIEFSEDFKKNGKGDADTGEAQPIVYDSSVAIVTLHSTPTKTNVQPGTHSYDPFAVVNSTATVNRSPIDILKNSVAQHSAPQRVNGNSYLAALTQPQPPKLLDQIRTIRTTGTNTTNTESSATSGDILATPPAKEETQYNETTACAVDRAFEIMSSQATQLIEGNFRHITLYIPPKRRMNRKVYEILRTLKEDHAFTATEDLKQLFEEMTETKATKISAGVRAEKKKRGLDDNLGVKLFDDYKRDMLNNMLRAMQEAQPIPDELSAISTQRITTENGITAVQNTEFRYTGTKCIEDILEYSILCAAYRIANVNPANVLGSWNDKEGIALCQLPIPLDLIKGQGGETHAVRAYAAMKEYVKKQENHRFVRQRLEDIMFPSMMAKHIRDEKAISIDSFEITPFDANEKQPESADKMTLENAMKSIYVPVLKIPLIQTKPIGSTSPNGIYGTVIVTAFNDRYNIELAQNTYFILNNYLAASMNKFSEKIWGAISDTQWKAPSE